MEHFDRPTYASCACTLLVAGGCFLGACGGSAAATDTTLPVSTGPGPTAEAARPSTTAHAHGEHQATARIGRAGGDLTLGNGARLEIPPGAITEETEVVFSLGEAVNAFRNREDEKIVGPSLVIAPELASANGSKFVVELPYTTLPEGFTEENVAVAFERQDESSSGFRGGAMRTTWDHAPARATSARKLRAEFASLPGMRVQFVVSN